MDGLLKKDIVIPTTRPSVNPLVSIEKRHRRVKEKKEKRESKKKENLKKQKAEEEIQQKAKEIIKKEEEGRLRKEKQEEAAIKVHVVAIKRQMRQQKERERTVETHLKSLEKGDKKGTKKEQKENEELVVRHSRRSSLEAVKEPMHQQNGEELRKLETMKRQKNALLKNRVEIFVTKRRTKMMGILFQAWYGSIIKYNGLLKKSVVMNEWRLLLRSWRKWSKTMKTRQAKEAIVQAAEELREENKKVMLAKAHYSNKVMRRCVQSWWAVTLSHRLHRNKDSHFTSIKDRVVEYLTEKKGEVRHDVRKNDDGVVTFTEVSMPTEGATSTGRKTNEIAIQTNSEGRAHEVSWSKAKHHVESLLNKGAKQMADKQMVDKQMADKQMAIELPQQPSQVNEEVGGSSTLDVPVKDEFPNLHLARSMTDKRTAQEMVTKRHPSPSPHPPPFSHPSSVVFYKPTKSTKPCTKPMEPKGMKERTILLSERKKAREERKLQKEQELREKLAAEEERKRIEEQERKDAEIKKRKEERMLAREKQAEKQRLLKHIKEQRHIADCFYTRHLIKKSFNPWKAFTCSMKNAATTARERYSLVNMRRAWKAWSLKQEKRIMIRNKQADGLYRFTLLANSVALWKEFVCREKEFMDHYRGIYNTRLLHKSFHGWENITNTERRKTWIKEKQAKTHRERRLLQIYVAEWKKYIPIAREEKQRMRRIADLYKIVKELLPDFDPDDCSDCSDNCSICLSD